MKEKLTTAVLGNLFADFTHGLAVSPGLPPPPALVPDNVGTRLSTGPPSVS